MSRKRLLQRRVRTAKSAMLGRFGGGFWKVRGFYTNPYRSPTTVPLLMKHLPCVKLLPLAPQIEHPGELPDATAHTPAPSVRDDTKRNHSYSAEDRSQCRNRWVSYLLCADCRTGVKWREDFNSCSHSHFQRIYRFPAIFLLHQRLMRYIAARPADYRRFAAPLPALAKTREKPPYACRSVFRSCAVTPSEEEELKYIRSSGLGL